MRTPYSRLCLACPGSPAKPPSVTFKIMRSKGVDPFLLFCTVCYDSGFLADWDYMPTRQSGCRDALPFQTIEPRQSAFLGTHYCQGNLPGQLKRKGGTELTAQLLNQVLAASMNLLQLCPEVIYLPHCSPRATFGALPSQPIEQLWIPYRSRQARWAS